MSAQRESWAKPQRESTRGIRELKYEASLKPQEPCNRLSSDMQNSFDSII